MDLKIDPDRNSPPPKALSGRASAGVISIGVEYEDENILIINKPSGLPVYSTKKRVREASVVSVFSEKYAKLKNVGDPERPGIVHRLDKQTSGLLVMAKNNEALEYLKKLFQSREIVKEYSALVYGELPKHGIIDQPLTKIGQRGISKVRVDEQGKKASTEYWSQEVYKRGVDPHTTTPFGVGVDQFTLVRVRLHTGRTHQIRVHFSYTQHPVMGDDLYGKPDSQKLANILHRQFLHASRLEFKLMDGTWLEVKSELPEELKNVLKYLVPEQA